jgi:hypothetical protein
MPERENAVLVDGGVVEMTAAWEVASEKWI